MYNSPAYTRINRKKTEMPTLTSEGAVRTAVKRGLPAVGPLDAEEDLRGGKGVRVKQTQTHSSTRDYLVILLRDDPEQVSVQLRDHCEPVGGLGLLQHIPQLPQAEAGLRDLPLRPGPEVREQGGLRQANGARTKVQGHQIAVHT